jgi:NarL family two-component system response regulator LiaR
VIRVTAMCPAPFPRVEGSDTVSAMEYGTRLMDDGDPTTDRDTDVLRVIVADDDPFARRAIKQALSQPGIIVIAEAHDGREAVELCLHYRPDVVLMDVVMPVLDGIAATRRIVKELPDQVVVILTSSGEQEFGFLGLRAGAAGFLSKDVDIDVLPQAMRGASQGEAVISRQLGMRLIEHLRRAPDGGTGMRPVKSPLTPREWEIIDLLVESKTTDEIADQLVLSTETVRSHVKNILRKLDVRSREEAVAVAQAMRGGLPGPPSS